MFAGHYAAAFAARGAAPRVPLWLFFVCVQLVDIAWALLVLGGVERVRLDPSLPSNPLVLEFMPYTHSLFATVLWSGASALLAWRFLPNALGAANRKLASLAIGLAVASHWFGDLLVHRPDLALFGETGKMGFGLWNAPVLALALEIGLIVAAASWCARRENDSTHLRVLAVAAILILMQAALVTLMGPDADASEDAREVVVSGLASFLLLPVLAWAAMWGTERDADLFHIAEPDAVDRWKNDAGEGYRAASLDDEGFVHCSTAEQLSATARRYYEGRNDLVVLEIDSNRLAAPVVFEDTSGSGESFPHVYGPIDTAAVVSERPLELSSESA